MARGDFKALLFVGLDEHAMPASVVDHVFISHPVRHRNDDLVARIDQRLGDVEYGVLAAHRNHAFGHAVVGTEIFLMPLADSFAQFLRTAGGGVFGEVG